MTNSDRTRAAAQAALDAYKASPGIGEVAESDEVNLMDLIADLLHLVDSLNLPLSAEDIHDQAWDYYELDNEDEAEIVSHVPSELIAEIDDALDDYDEGFTVEPPEGFTGPWG